MSESPRNTVGEILLEQSDHPGGGRSVEGCVRGAYVWCVEGVVSVGCVSSEEDGWME